MHALRLGPAVGHQVAAQLATGRLDCDVRLTGGHPKALGEDLEVVDQRFHRLVDAGPGWRRDLAVFRAVGALRHLVEALGNDAHRLPNLVQTDGIAIEGVAVGTDDDVKVNLVVGQVRHGAAQVPGFAGAAEQRPRGRHGNGLLSSHDADALGAVPPDRLAGHQRVELDEPVGQHRQDVLHVVLPAVGQVGRHTAWADVVVVHPQAGDALEEPQDLFSLAPAVEHHPDRAEVHAVRGQKQQVRAHAVQLAHQHANPGSSRRDLRSQQVFDGEAEHQLGEQRRGVIHAGDVRRPLQVGEILGGLLHAGVEVADDRL